MSAEIFTGCERLLSATANGVYQGIIITVLVGLALRLFARTNAATRYAAWFGMLLLTAALIPAHVLVSCLPHSQVAAPDIAAAADPQPTVFAQPGDANTADWPATDYGLSDPQSGETLASAAEAVPQEESASDAAIFRRTFDMPAAESATPGLPRSLLKPFALNLETPVNLPRSICMGLLAAWALFASVRFGLIAVRINEVRRLKKMSRAPSPGLRTTFEKIHESLAAKRGVQLRISSAHRAAIVLGFVHPAILLPAEMDNDANDGEVEHVLRHELAHVERRDDWGNLAQQIVEAALFFHPAIWWISRQLSLEREIACDDHVLEASGRPRAYALTLANAAIRMIQRRHSLAPGVSNNSSQLQQRITMILNTNRDRSPRLARSRLGFFTATTAILAILAISAGPRLVLAQSPAPEAAAASPDLSGPDTGPKYKPGTSDDDSAPPAAPENPPTPAAPAQISVGRIIATAPMEPMPPAPAAEPMIAVAPVRPVNVSVDADEVPEAKPGKHHMSVEDRLDRIERILDRLQARGDMKDRRHIDGKVSVDGKPMASYAPGQMQMDFKFDDTFKRSAEAAQWAAEQAQRAAEAGQRAAEQAMRDMAREKGKDFERLQNSFRDMQSEGPARELEALKNARESLDREVQKLTQQIKRLEEEKSRLQKHGRSDDSSGPGDDGKAESDQKP